MTLFIVSTVLQQSAHKHNAELPISTIFEAKGMFKLFLFKFHDKFDGLFDLDVLRFLKAKLDYENE